MKHILSLILLSLFLSFNVNAQVVDWIAGEPGMAIDVNIDPFNDVYTCGQIVGTNNVIGPYVFNSNGAQDVVVQKHDMNGNLIWATHFGGTGSDFSAKVMFDGLSSVWVTGHFQSSMNVGGFNLTSSGGYDVFFVKLDAISGTVLFAQKGGTSSNDYALDLDIDANQNVYVSGTFTGTFSYPGASVAGGGGLNTFMIKLDEFGNSLLAFGITSASIVSGYTNTLDSGGNIYMSGYSTGASVSFNGSVQSMGTNSSVVAKFNSAGVFQAKYDAAFTGENYGLCVDAAGSMYYTGNYGGTGTFGSHTLNNGGDDNILLVKINASGSFAWAKQFGGTGNDQGYDLKCKPNGDLFLTGSYTGSFSFGPFPISGGGSSRAYVAKLDSAGTVKWITTGSSSSSVISNSVDVNASGDIFITGPGAGLMTMGGDTATITQSFLVKLADDANVMEGYVFIDTDNDGIRDANEVGLPNAILQLDGGPYVENSAANGKYNMYTTSGTHTVTMPNVPLYHTLTTGSSQVATFTGMGNTDTANHFGLHPVANVKDLQIDITAVTAPKAGHVLDYMITYKNVGTTALNGTVTLQADAQLTFVTASPAPDAQAGSLFTWNVGTLNPGVSGSLHALFNIPTSATIGTPITSVAQISPVVGDSTTGNNTETITNLVTGPYDPNYKEVDIDTLWNVSSSDWLEYVVHFQNVGNDTAYNVVIVDTMSSYLDLSTLEILYMSHQPMNFNITNGNVLDFRFINIMLPDSTIDPIGSNGFVKFRVKYVSTIPFNATIDNFVDIYFDFNSPVRTNTAVTLHLDASSVSESLYDKQTLHLFPNPTNGNASFDFTSEPTGDAMVRVIDVTGRTVMVQQLKKGVNVLECASFQSGEYLITVQNADKTFHTRFVKW